MTSDILENTKFLYQIKLFNTSLSIVILYLQSINYYNLSHRHFHKATNQ